MGQPMLNGSSVASTPEYGRRLIIDVIEDYAINEPSRPFVYAPVSENITDGWKAISYKELSNAINHLAHELVERKIAYGQSGDDFPTVGYIGPNDVRYAIVMFACVKAHHKAFFMSPRNSLAGQLSLLRATGCHMLYYADSFLPVVLPWLESHPMRLAKAPTEAWLQLESPPFPYKRTFEEGQWDPLVVLHTSGSSGIPKPVTVRQGSFAIADGLRHGPDLHDTPSLWEFWGSARKFFLPMPQFHAAGVAHIMSTGIYYGAAVVLPHTHCAPTADLVAQSLIQSGADGTILPPSIVEGLAQTETGIAALGALKYAGFAGGNLSPKIGDMLARRGVMLSNLIASTECMPYSLHFQFNPRLWQYFIINAREMGAEFRPLPWDANIFEMVLSHDDPGNPGRKSAFYTFPNKNEWSTGDLFRPHPTLPDHWAYHGRVDDVICLSNGEKVNPLRIEEVVTGHPGVKGALVVGAGQFQPALILEPAKCLADEAASLALIDEVWPLVVQANKSSASHEQITREFVVLSDPEKPFSRAGKGSIQRNLTVREYSDFITRIYQQVEERVQEDMVPDLTDKSTLATSIVDILISRVGNTQAAADTDLFSIGVDSLQVTQLSRYLISGLSAAGHAIDKSTITPQNIYASRTPAGLAEHIMAVIRGDSTHNDSSPRINDLSATIAKYTRDLPAPRKGQSPPLDDGQTVLVTGTTGSLGSYILDSLISNQRVKRVVALNRDEDGGQCSQAVHHTNRGLSLDFSKVEFLCTDLSLPTWGLGNGKYYELLAHADRIIHTAWPVNFIISIAAFEPQIVGVRRLVNFSNAASKRVPIIFLSSISTVGGWITSQSVPEQQLDDLKLPLNSYGQSKLAGSLILDAAVQCSGVPAASIRVGQIAGPRSEAGMWNRFEMLPSLIASSVHMGILPDTLGAMDVIDWMPAEDVAGLVLDVAGVTSPKDVSSISGYYNAVNPTTTTWQELADILMDHYAGRIKKIVPLEDWVAALRASDVTTDPARNPAIKLIDSYQSMLDRHKAGIKHTYFDMERTMDVSPRMKAFGPVSGEMMRNWCDQWNF